jgi:hypothetical protein
MSVERRIEIFSLCGKDCPVHIARSGVQTLSEGASDVSQESIAMVHIDRTGSSEDLIELGVS